MCLLLANTISTTAACLHSWLALYFEFRFLLSIYAWWEITDFMFCVRAYTRANALYDLEVIKKFYDAEMLWQIKNGMTLLRNMVLQLI